MSKKMCEECFALIEDCDCDEFIDDTFEITIADSSKKRKSRSDKWEPNIKPNEKWFKVPSDYKAYK